MHCGWTKQGGVAATLYTCIQEMLSSNKSLGHQLLSWWFCGFCQSLHANAGAVLQLGHDHFQILFHSLLTSSPSTDTVNQNTDIAIM